MAKIKVFREKAWADSLRKYKIIIDGREVDVIKQGETKMLKVTPGNHNIYLKIDYCRSRTIDFDISEDNEAVFRCKGLSGFPLLFILFYLLIFFTRYIKLEEVNSD